MRMPAAMAALFLVLCALVPPAGAQQPPQAAVQALATAGFGAKAALLEQIADSGEPWARPVLQALLDGDLQVRKADGQVVLTRPATDGFALYDPIDGQQLGQAGRFDLKRLPINNALRGQLRTLIATLSLGDPDPARRRAAVRALYDEIDPAMVARLRDRQAAERDGDVREAIDIALALADLKSGDDAARIAAAEQLSGSVEPDARVAAVARRADRLASLDAVAITAE